MTGIARKTLRYTKQNVTTRKYDGEFAELYLKPAILLQHTDAGGGSKTRQERKWVGLGTNEQEAAS